VRKWCDQILLIITYNIHINRQVINIFVDCLMDCTTHALRDTSRVVYNYKKYLRGGKPPGRPLTHACMHAGWTECFPMDPCRDTTREYSLVSRVHQLSSQGLHACWSSACNLQRQCICGFFPFSFSGSLNNGPGPCRDHPTGGPCPASTARQFTSSIVVALATLDP
jgi:hypothetical protein